MKILFVTPYITNPAHSALHRNTTGFGFMVNDIAKNVGRLNDVRVFPVNAFVPELALEGFTVDSWSKKKLISKFSFKPFLEALKFLKRYPVPIRDKIRILYQFLAVFSKRDDLMDFDIVHIHGCSPITAATIKLCKRYNKPFIITLHGLVSFENSVRLHDSLKKYEKDFLLEAFQNNYNLTFISSGNRNQVLEYINSKLKS